MAPLTSASLVTSSTSSRVSTGMRPTTRSGMAFAASRITFPLMEWPTSTTFSRERASTTARTS